MKKKVNLKNWNFDKRPWGNFEEFTLNEPTTVKVITVNPGEKLSIQKHKLRDEFWKILDGPGKMTLNDKVFKVKKGEEYLIKKNEIHSMEALDKEVRFLEIAFGHFDENDIERLEDRYGRK